jgi:uncharacterized membrane protein
MDVFHLRLLVCRHRSLPRDHQPLLYICQVPANVHYSLEKSPRDPRDFQVLADIQAKVDL